MKHYNWPRNVLNPRLVPRKNQGWAEFVSPPKSHIFYGRLNLESNNILQALAFRKQTGYYLRRWPHPQMKQVMRSLNPNTNRALPQSWALASRTCKGHDFGTNFTPPPPLPPPCPPPPPPVHPNKKRTLFSLNALQVNYSPPESIGQTKFKPWTSSTLSYTGCSSREVRIIRVPVFFCSPF